LRILAGHFKISAGWPHAVPGLDSTDLHDSVLPSCDRPTFQKAAICKTEASLPLKASWTGYIEREMIGYDYSAFIGLGSEKKKSNVLTFNWSKSGRYDFTSVLP